MRVVLLAFAALIPYCFINAEAGFACLSNPCLYGICIDELNSSYTCYCIDGYTGVHCQTNWDECWSNPCHNGGSCIDGIAAYNCSCPPGYTGPSCESNVDECSSNPCQNNGTCHDKLNGFVCSCHPGFTGLFCEVDLAVCNTTEGRCENGGVCIEGPGLSFSCLCNPGWTGSLCQSATNECESSPCQNGGVCVDLHAAYTCACLFGFTGRNCDIELKICENSPCLNEALCLEEEEEQVCYCVPDYHGNRCQYQYDECQITPRCKNGGTCIDGVDQATCSCPPDLTGRYCECLITGQNQRDFDCSYVRTTTLGWTTNETFPPDWTDDTTESSDRTFWTLESTPESTDIGTQDTTSLATEGREGQDFVTTHYQTTTKKVSKPTSSTISIDTVVTMDTTRPKVTTALPGDVDTEVTQMETSTLAGQEPESSTLYQMEDTTVEKKDGVETTTESKIEENDIPGEEVTTEKGKDITTTEVDTTHDTTKTPIVTITSKSKTLKPKLKTTAIPSNLTPLDNSGQSNTTLLPDSHRKNFTDSGVDTKVTSPTTSRVDKPTTPKVITPSPQGTTKLSSTPESSKPFSTPGVPRVSTVAQPDYPTTYTESEVDIGRTTLPSVDIDRATVETPIGVTKKTETTLMTESFPSTTATPDCTKIPCLNQGTCFYTKQGPKCACKPGWEGALCEDIQGIRTPAFTGRSYLTHGLNSTSGVVLGLGVRTLAPTGLIFYAQVSSNIYMSLYLEDGLLKFQFSCGVQTMLFSEVQIRVNNGFDINILAMVELVPLLNTSLHCVASLRINNTLVMSGEQVAVMHKPDDFSSGLYLGGIPSHVLHQINAPVTAGMTGCISSLQIDGEERQVYKEAEDFKEITECSSLACLSNPCFGSATCVEFGDTYNCHCPSGYVGITCELSVCANNPCMFGATCVEYPGSGFLCLCPLGKHGIFCEHDIEIGQASYSSSMSGLSSFSAYVIPANIHHCFELKFRFVPNSFDQIALLAFIGQDYQHDAITDHLAVSFIKGYVVLTWNLGSGPRRIFTPNTISAKSKRGGYTVRVGKNGQQCWLIVDNMGNVTSKSPGRLTQLNTKPMLYLGGHFSKNFSILPHDLPLHSGFSGCIFDVELSAGNVGINLYKTRAAEGRGVGQCGTSQCHNHTCSHGGACMNHGATFSCLCADGWFGPLCASRYNLCDSTRHNCSFGATCVPLTHSYECDCPPGRTGKFCEKDESLSDISFSGRRSYISLPSSELHLHEACIDLEIRPTKDKGLVMYFGHPQKNSMMTLSLQGGVLELRVLMLGNLKRNGEIVIVRSGRVLAMNEWSRVKAGRFGRKLFLWVNGITNTGVLLPGESLLPSDSPLYLGGAKDLSELPAGSVSGLPVPMEGCIRRLQINWTPLPLNKSTIQDGRNVKDCDGTACGGDVCLHGGSCWLDIDLEAHCACPEQYTGTNCETEVSCEEVECLNHGRCISEGNDHPPHCSCPAGWSGSFCEDEIPRGAARFNANSYLVVDKLSPKKALQKKRGIFVYDVHHIYVNFSSASPDGMIFWSSSKQGEYIALGLEQGLLKLSWSWYSILFHSTFQGEYIALGLEQGLLKLSWSWSGLIQTIVVPGDGIADGIWHDVSISFPDPMNITVVLDKHLVYTYQHDVESNTALTTNGKFYLGGFPDKVSVANRTRGIFKSSFSGCLSEIAWNDSPALTDFKKHKGENVKSCALFEV
ncbi:hypothetical protein M8J75_002023 [Diaphorina citri]|nr:hypothetical protein M8J75_002023 [Diaphorina citri]